MRFITPMLALTMLAVLVCQSGAQKSGAEENEARSKLLKELDDLFKKEADLAPPVPGKTSNLLKFLQSEDRSVREKAISLLGNRVYGRALFGSDNWVGINGREGTIDRESYQALKGLLERIDQLENRLAELKKKKEKSE